MSKTMVMFRSATFKLTMWYLAIVMAISLVFSIVLYHVATNELARGLHREMMRISTDFPVFKGSPLLKSGSDYAAGSHRILLRLVGLNFLVLAAAGAASYFLARRTLSPIEVAHQQQQRFTSDVSHELRTPLTAIKMESEVGMMNAKASTNELRDIIKSNLEETAKLEGLINNLMRLTRLEESELRHSFEPVDTQAIANQALATINKFAASRGISIKHNVASQTVNGDPESLQQLLVIFLDNAIKYSPANSELTITGQAVGPNYEFTIQDHGSGIKPAALDHIFERFYRADDSRAKTMLNNKGVSENTPGTEGYGLGLSIAKMIADVHQAVITVSSEVDKGTIVHLSLTYNNK